MLLSSLHFGAQTGTMRLTAGQWITPTVRLVRPLGAGGMSTLWVAADMRLHTQVAVKFLSVQLVNDETARLRFKREAKLASQIESPYLVQTYDIGHLPDGMPFIVMEWLEGESLKVRLRRDHRLIPRTCASVVSQISSAINKAHATGVIHRDIKPDNVFVLRHDAGILIKLLDFGVAKRIVGSEEEVSLVTPKSETLGTPSYMSPEQLRHASQVDYRTDLWALSVLAYRLLFGDLPFPKTDYPSLCLSIVEGRFALPSTFDPNWGPALDAFFTRSFTKKIDARFRSAEETSTSLALALGPLGDTQPAAAPQDSGAQ